MAIIVRQAARSLGQQDACRATYNASMFAAPIAPRPTILALVLAGLMMSSFAWAQSPPGAASLQTTARPSDPPLEPGRGSQTIERIRTEDAGSRIDELRVGGQTQSIVVQPKGDMPAYEIRPMDTRPGPSQGGARVWNFLRF
jgi:hypothetical protein